MKRVLSIVVLFISISSFAQNTFTARNTFNDTIYYKKNLVSASNSDSVLVKTAGTNGYLVLAPRSAMGISAITADNGLTASTSTNVQLGGTLTKNTIINQSASNNYLQILGNNGNAIFNGDGTLNLNVNGNQLAFVSSVVGTGAGGGTAGVFDVKTPSTNDVHEGAIAIRRLTSGTAANGIGVGAQFYIQDQAGGLSATNTLISKLTDATAATRTSQFIITGVASATTNNLLILKGDGTVNIPTNVQNFANNAAAITGGLSVGDLYRNGDVLQIVH